MYLKQCVPEYVSEFHITVLLKQQLYRVTGSDTQKLSQIFPSFSQLHAGKVTTDHFLVFAIFYSFIFIVQFSINLDD